MEDIKKRILDKIKPSDEEREYLTKVANELMYKIDSITFKVGLMGVKTQLVGSAARGTWISGTHDLDIFIMFPDDTSREDLESYGLSVGRQIAKEAQEWDEHYAEHPYVKMKYGGFDVDLVPCYSVSSAECILSAVDRTPFHNEFIKANLSGREDDVLLLKQFMKGTGVYGSELKTEGFSGYLTELLVINYGSFEKVLEAASEWRPGLLLDLIEHGAQKFEDPLVVIDPTDPRRNVAAALSLDKFCTFIDASRSFLEDSDESMFFASQEPPLSDAELLDRMDLRGTSLVAIVFKTPDVVDDIFYPQFAKMEHSIVPLLEKNEFTVLKAGKWSGEDSVVFLELISKTLPDVKRHRGPPVWVRAHAEAFRSKYVDNPDAYSLTIRDGFYVAEIPRKYIDAVELLESEVAGCSLGKHISKSVKEGFTVLEGEQILDLKDEGLRSFLNGWL
ncbi:CCA tRNA nucleotidyltransferase [Methanococcoides methylutens]|uniref:CCA-adding enzyme n=1 Tax=Methanococcoides methylutens MM1 TaxID=1434104 RepID=A0A0E3SSX4_METMT|nr:CCA tRNA nucleotidyltransferase [Methanococcoides methylutens]AKB85627.1 tRNA nucleotidyltransferase, archaeal type [Methanococcoides methylutens MM1]